MGAVPRAARALVLAAGSLLAFVADAAPGIVLIGDDYSGVLMRDVAAHERAEIRRDGDVYALDVRNLGLTLRNLAPGGAVTALADTLHSSEIGLLVVDATRGPTAAVREHVLIARQARTPMLAVMFVKVALLHDKAGEEAGELLDIEMQEIRELLAAYQLDADSVRVFYDARPAGLDRQPDAIGIREALRVLSLFEPRRAGAAADMRSAAEIWAAVYLLTDAQTGTSSGTLSPKASLVVWSEGAHANATLDSLSAYHPGEFREMPLTMHSPLELREGSRLLLVSGERVIGLGAVTQIGR